MYKRNDIIDAIKAGKIVTYCGNLVTMEGSYSWQYKNLWINLSNGAAYKADGRQIRIMIIDSN